MNSLNNFTFQHSEPVQGDETGGPPGFSRIIPCRVSKYRNRMVAGARSAKKIWTESLGTQYLACSADATASSLLAMCFPECPPNAAASLGELMQVKLSVNGILEAMDAENRNYFTQEAILALLFEFCQSTLGELTYPATAVYVKYYRKVTRFATAEAVSSILGYMAQIGQPEISLVEGLSFEDYKNYRAGSFASRSWVGLFCHLIGIQPPQVEIEQVDRFLRHGYLSTALIYDLYTFNPKYEETEASKDCTTKNALHVIMRLYHCTEVEARHILMQEIERSQRAMMDGYAAWENSNVSRAAQTKDYAALAILYVGGCNQWIITSHSEGKSDGIEVEKEIIVLNQSCAGVAGFTICPPSPGFDRSSITPPPFQRTKGPGPKFPGQFTDTHDIMSHLFDHPIPQKIRLCRALPIRRVIEWISKRTQSLATSLVRRHTPPQHIAFVLDGNRRWAKSRGVSVAFGHVRGLGKILETLDLCYRSGIHTVTIYVFSIENFKRPKAQVDFLLMLISVMISTMGKPNSVLHRFRASARFMGREDLLPPSMVTEIENLVQNFQHYTDHQLNICLAYTGRDEITRTIRQTVEEAQMSGRPVDEEVTAEALTRNMVTHDSPPLDLWVRTSGERRLSDFLLWQCHEESRIRFIKPTWPEFGPALFYALVRKWQQERWKADRTSVKDNWLRRGLDRLKRRDGSVLTHGLRDEDVKTHVESLSSLPDHLSVIITLQNGERHIEQEIAIIARMVMWASSAGIPTFSVYERTGVIKSSMQEIRAAITENCASYCLPEQTPPVLITSSEHGHLLSEAVNVDSGHSKVSGINLILLSASDGRDSIVELTKTLALAAQQGILSPSEVTLELVASKVADTVIHHANENGINTREENSGKVRFPQIKPDPDLLISFAKCLTLEGYPPWQLRLTEIFCSRDHGIKGQGLNQAYKAFIKSLYFFAGVEMRFGK